MVIKVCPVCSTRYVINPLYEDDNVHDCVSDSEALRNIDLVKLGTYTDDEGVAQQVANPFKAAMGNKLWGSRAWTEGAGVDDFTSRGNIADTHRTFKRSPYAKHRGTLFKKVKLEVK